MAQIPFLANLATWREIHAGNDINWLAKTQRTQRDSKGIYLLGELSGMARDSRKIQYHLARKGAKDAKRLATDIHKKTYFSLRVRNLANLATWREKVKIYREEDMTENEIASIAVDAIYEVYRGLGPGLLESVYQKVLLYELKKRGLEAVPEVNIPIRYDGHDFGSNLRADIVIDNKGHP